MSAAPEAAAKFSNRKVRISKNHFFSLFDKIVQVKIHKADIPQDKTDKVIVRLNEALDKYQIEKVSDFIFWMLIFLTFISFSAGHGHICEKEM